MPTSPLDVLAEELGVVAGRIERECALRIGAAIADLRRVDAERELRLTNLERAVIDRLASVKDGERGLPGEVGPQGERGEKGDIGEHGEPGSIGERGLLGEMGAKGDAGERGEKGDIGDIGERGEPGPIGERGLPGEIGAKGDAGERGEKGAPGALPLVSAWVDKIHYEGATVAQAGATYQALCDTAREPPHDDWRCIAAAGRAGNDAVSFVICGTFDEKKTDYRALNVVALGGASFAARRDNPGPCPGDGWQLIAAQGKRGNPGESGKSVKGDPGTPGKPVTAVAIDDEGLLTLSNGDGSTVECDLYPLLAKVQRAAGKRP